VVLWRARLHRGNTPWPARSLAVRSVVLSQKSADPDTLRLVSRGLLFCPSGCVILSHAGTWAIVAGRAAGGWVALPPVRFGGGYLARAPPRGTGRVVVLDSHLLNVLADVVLVPVVVCVISGVSNVVPRYLVGRRIAAWWTSSAAVGVVRAGALAAGGNGIVTATSSTWNEVPYFGV